MRTTLTLEDDLAARLKEIARQGGRSFKEVTNEAIRRGLSAAPSQVEGIEPFRVEASDCGFRSGIDPLRLNQLVDDLEIADLGAPSTGEVHEP